MQYGNSQGPDAIEEGDISFTHALFYAGQAKQAIVSFSIYVLTCLKSVALNTQPSAQPVLYFIDTHLLDCLYFILMEF
jgi:hypothetical protein